VDQTVSLSLQTREELPNTQVVVHEEDGKSVGEMLSLILAIVISFSLDGFKNFKTKLQCLADFAIDLNEAAEVSRDNLVDDGESKSVPTPKGLGGEHGVKDFSLFSAEIPLPWSLTPIQRKSPSFSRVTTISLFSA